MPALIGRVVSTAMQKTVVVRVEGLLVNARMNSARKHKKKFMAHNEHEVCSFGDTVKIAECAPISKKKKWIVEEIVKQSS